jgi:hypothetical protein
MAFDHEAVVVSEREFLSDLAQGLGPPDQYLVDEAEFTIFASRPLPGESVSSTASVRKSPMPHRSACGTDWIRIAVD